MIDVGLSHHTQAVLLLTAHLGKSADGTHKPLSPGEWGRFAQWLKEHDVHPEHLLLLEPGQVLADWDDSRVTLERLRFLLGRASTLALATERWLRAGLWVLTRADADYPKRLKRRLGVESPPFFIGCGNRRLLDQGGVAVVGSRNATPDDLAFTAGLAMTAARQGLGIISGGARGVDETAMLTALERQGTAVGVLADSLLRAATSSRYRPGLMSNDLVLVSPFNPEAGFDVGTAMSRNKYVYCLSDAAIVVDATQSSGGTWQGAVENLRKGWVPLWVKETGAERSGNAALVAQGARWLAYNVDDLSALSAPSPREPTTTGGQLKLGLPEEPATVAIPPGNAAG